MDTACSTSSYAVHVAYQSLRQGICDAAIIAGGNLCLKVATNLAFAKLGVLSTDCIVRSFDENGIQLKFSFIYLLIQKTKSI